jgi:hypothetical protein
MGCSRKERGKEDIGDGDGEAPSWSSSCPHCPVVYPCPPLHVSNPSCLSITYPPHCVSLSRPCHLLPVFMSLSLTSPLSYPQSHVHIGCIILIFVPMWSASSSSLCLHCPCHLCVCIVHIFFMSASSMSSLCTCHLHLCDCIIMSSSPSPLCPHCMSCPYPVVLIIGSGSSSSLIPCHIVSCRLWCCKNIVSG